VTVPGAGKIAHLLRRTKPAVAVTVAAQTQGAVIAVTARNRKRLHAGRNPRNAHVCLVRIRAVALSNIAPEPEHAGGRKDASVRAKRPLPLRSSLHALHHRMTATVTVKVFTQSAVAQVAYLALDKRGEEEFGVTVAMAAARAVVAEVPLMEEEADIGVGYVMATQEATSLRPSVATELWMPHVAVDADIQTMTRLRMDARTPGIRQDRVAVAGRIAPASRMSCAQPKLCAAIAGQVLLVEVVVVCGVTCCTGSRQALLTRNVALVLDTLHVQTGGYSREPIDSKMLVDSLLFINLVRSPRVGCNKLWRC